MNPVSAEVRLARHPHGVPCLEDFVTVEAVVPKANDGQVLVRNMFASVDPGQRALMQGGESYVETYSIGAPLTGRAVGEVIESRAANVAVGDLVFHRLGWREYAVVESTQLRVLNRELAEPSAFLGALGYPGFTAWVGVTKVAQVRAGEVVYVSSAAGAVGALAGQLARLRGAEVLGSTGTDEKVRYIERTLGFSAGINYRKGDLAEALAAAAPAGIDVYFDNVGGHHLEAALDQMSVGARAALCGSLATYNSEKPFSPANFRLIADKRLALRGFLVYDFEECMSEFEAEVAPLLRDGELLAEQTVFEGLESMPRAFLSLFSHSSRGKTIVKL